MEPIPVDQRRNSVIRPHQPTNQPGTSRNSRRGLPIRGSRRLRPLRTGTPVPPVPTRRQTRRRVPVRIVLAHPHRIKTRMQAGMPGGTTVNQQKREMAISRTHHRSTTVDTITVDGVEYVRKDQTECIRRLGLSHLDRLQPSSDVITRRFCVGCWREGCAESSFRSAESDSASARF